MSVIAVIPQSASDFDPIPITTLPVLQVFGFEKIVDPNSFLEDIRIYTSGVSCLLDTDLDTLAKMHPDAWVSNNPMAGQWYPVDPHRFHNQRVRIMEDEDRLQNHRATQSLYEITKKTERIKKIFFSSDDYKPSNWKQCKANRTLR